MVTRILILVVVAWQMILPLSAEAGRDQNRGESRQLTKSELITELKRLDAEIWNRSLACAGIAAIAPLQAQYGELIEQLHELEREPHNSLDQGGDVCSNATVISSIPFTDSGTTTGYNDDYVTPCMQFQINGSPDVVYSYTPTTTDILDVTLCGSSFDTGLSIWLNCPGTSDPVMLCCSDDAPGCGAASCCPAVIFTPGYTYYIVVDGNNGSSGNYTLRLDLPVEPPCGVPAGCAECPINASYESEACPATCCPDPNAGPGCFGSGWEPISCGQTSCGKITHTTSYLDKDAYLFTLTQRDSVRFCVIAEFPVTLVLVPYDPFNPY